MNLYMVMLGCTPPGRNTEQHDIFFGIGNNLQELKPAMLGFWPEGKARLHADAIRIIRKVEGWQVKVGSAGDVTGLNLYFVNMGGYAEGHFAELHDTVLTIQPTIARAKAHARKTPFFKEHNIARAPAHIDNKYGVAIDEVANVKDILPEHQQGFFSLRFEPAPEGMPEDEMHLGYFLMNSLPLL